MWTPAMKGPAEQAIVDQGRPDMILSFSRNETGPMCTLSQASRTR